MRACELYEGIFAFSHLPVWKKAVSGLSHQGLIDALIDYCLVMGAPASSSWPTNKVFGQKLRYITSYTLIGNYIQFLDDPFLPPTLTALQAKLTASPRQVAELVKNLRAGGYVEAIPDPRDRRSLHLIPTLSLLLEVAKSPLAFLKSAEELGFCPPGTYTSLLMAPELMMRWMGRSVRAYQAQDVLFSPFPTIVRFSERDAGYVILTAVIAAAYMGAQGREPPFALTYDGLAKQFQVSRQHIGNLFGEAEPFFTVRAGSILSISPDLICEFNTFALGQMAHYSLLAEQVLEPSASLSLAEIETLLGAATGRC
jgi:hypothetical protein